MVEHDDARSYDEIQSEEKSYGSTSMNQNTSVLLVPTQSSKLIRIEKEDVLSNYTTKLLKRIEEIQQHFMRQSRAFMFLIQNQL